MIPILLQAESLAWSTWQAYMDGYRHSPDLTRADRAAHLLKAREYKRRGIRVSQYLNRRKVRP